MALCPLPIKAIGSLYSGVFTDIVIALIKNCTVHAQTAVKVNALVDEGIAPLVEALNLFQGVLTIDSCQGGDCQKAYVWFHYGDSPGELASFLHELSVSLGAFLDSCCEFVILMEWLGGTETPTAKVVTDPDYISNLAEALQAVAKPPRRIASVDGSAGTTLRS